jgi:hypothetical protein
MAQRVRIECINKTPRNDPHLRIRNVGGENGDGTRWKMNEEEAIKAIEAGKYAFYVSVGGHSVDVEIAEHLGHKYLKTTADGLHPNNLLSLPECP